MRKTYTGRYIPKFPEKYRGDVKNIVFRSLWERKVMFYLDTNLNVLEWWSEELAIPYVSPVDGKYHRYFPDFGATAITKSGTKKTFLIEVKPFKQTKEPEIKKRKTRQYLTEVVTYGVNQAKWKAAREYCIDRGWEFKLVTEIELGMWKAK